MSYISQIRQKIGHDLLIYMGAGVIVTQNGKILLQQRKDNGVWALHAGGIEPGEELEATARRELKEETGLVAGQLDMLGVYSGSDRYLTYPNGDQIYMPNVYYICRDFTDRLNPQAAEVQQLKWFDLDDLPENIHKPNQRAIQDFIQLIKNEKK